MKGFTLLEVVVALAITAGVALTVLGAVNHHLAIIADEGAAIDLTILGREFLDELGERSPGKTEGTLAPAHPDVIWRAEVADAGVPGLSRLVLALRQGRSEVRLVRYIPKP